MAKQTAEERRAYMRDYRRAWARERRARWVAAGGCARCGVPVQKFKNCAECRAKMSKSYYRTERRKRMWKRCPKHPRVFMYKTAKRCHICQTRALALLTMARNKTIGPVRTWLRQGPQTLPQLARLVNRSEPAVRNALRRLMREEGLVEDRSARVPVYRFVKEQAA